MKREYTQLITAVNDYLSTEKRTFKWLERHTKRILSKTSYKPDTLGAWNSILNDVRLDRVKIGYKLNKRVKTFVNDYLDFSD